MDPNKAFELVRTAVTKMTHQQLITLSRVVTTEATPHRPIFTCSPAKNEIAALFTEENGTKACTEVKQAVQDELARRIYG